MCWDYLQELFKFQSQYGLRLIAETDVDIEADKFDPNKSNATLQLAAAEDEIAEWVARSTKNPDWKDKDKFFKKVHVVSISVNCCIHKSIVQMNHFQYGFSCKIKYIRCIKYLFQALFGQCLID